MKLPAKVDNLFPSNVEGYPVLYYSHDGSEWCNGCASQDAEPPIEDCDIFYEGPSRYCDGCDKEIESAYGDHN